MPIIFGGSTCQTLAKEVVEELNFELGSLIIRRFPDGELYLRVKGEVKGEDCIVIQSTSRPQDSNLLELFLTLETLKNLGANKITTVVPYFGYGRQDKIFKVGAVSSRAVAKHLQLHTDEFLTVNIHEANILNFFNITSKELDASPLLGDYFKTHQLDAPIVIGPDRGAVKIAESVAKVIGCDFDYLEKRRLAPGKVEMEPKNLKVDGKDVILVDDMIDSGSTMLEAIKMLSPRTNNILIGCIHPVLTGNVITRLFAAGALDVVATNTIPSQISFITVASVIADALH